MLLVNGPLSLILQHVPPCHSCVSWVCKPWLAAWRAWSVERQVFWKYHLTSMPSATLAQWMNASPTRVAYWKGVKHKIIEAHRAKTGNRLPNQSIMPPLVA